MALLSVSIDLAGSTLVKQSIIKYTRDNSKKRKELYGEYLKLLFTMEREFYLLLADYSYFDFSKLFLVKLIGDECWYAYEVDPDDRDQFQGVAWAFFDALMNLLAGERYISVGGWDGGEDPVAQRDGALRGQFDLPVKAYVDLFIEPIEINIERYEYLKDVPGHFGGADPAIYHLDRDYIEFCNRLNLGSPEVLGTRHRVRTRADYIGLEVDRFFRLTKFCNPRLLGAGMALMERLPHRIEPVAPDLEHIAIKLLALETPGGPGDRQTQRKYVIPQLVPAADMKHIGEDYTIYHLFGGTSLGDALYAPIPFVETLMEPTRAFLARHGFYALDRASLVP